MRPDRITSRLQALAPVATISATLGLAALVYLGDDRRGAIVGFAQGVPEAVASLEAARVASVRVSVGEQVQAGQVIATLDTSLLDAELSQARAERARIEATVRAEQALLEQRLEIDVESLERERSRQREEQLRATAEAKALDGQIARVERLVEDRQAVLGDLAPLKLQQATVAAVAGEKPKTLGLIARQLEAAEQRRQRAREQSWAVAKKLEADLEVAERQIERLERRRAGYELRATRGGRVSAIGKQAGEVAGPGEAVVSLVSARDRVVACLPERMGLGAALGDGARLWVRGQRGEPLSGKVVALGPLVAELPSRCWLSPSLPVWGREITVALDSPLELVPGQAFDVTVRPTFAYFLSSTPQAPPQALAQAAQGATAASAPAAQAGASPRKMTVPRSLAERTRLEPSGLLARPGERRYLFVSDDTGRDATEGLPWIFALSPDGSVDPAPVTLGGVSKIDDLEAIAQGDGGEIYLLSSQSHSRKGKRKAARTALLRARFEGQGLRVDGEIHLAELLDADPERASALGLPQGTAALDIEGMSFDQGALFFGLKAPLDERGEAMVWRVASPRALFEAGRGPAKGRPLLDAGASLWAHARLDVELEGKATPGGISEMLFLADGSLALASTPSTADGAAGALWRVDRPGPGALSPRLVRRFPGLKPEGMAPSLTPGNMFIVFDEGAETPSFLELPWPP